MNDSVSITNNTSYQYENTLENYQIEKATLDMDNKIPSTLVVCRTIQNQELLTPFKNLFNSEGSHSMIHSRCLPPEATPSLLQNEPTKFQTVAELLDSNRQVFMDNIMFPEFDKTKHVSGATTFVFDTECKYDMIPGLRKKKCAGLIASFL